MIWALRIAFWLQALLGLGLARALTGARPLGIPSTEGDLHMLVGTIAAVLAIVVLRGGDTITTVARFFPLVPLAMGLLIRFGGLATAPTTIVHIVLGVVAIGLVEMAVARRRRQARAEAGTGAGT